MKMPALVVITSAPPLGEGPPLGKASQRLPGSLQRLERTKRIALLGELEDNLRHPEALRGSELEGVARVVGSEFLLLRRRQLLRFLLSQGVDGELAAQLGQEAGLIQPLAGQ